MSDEEYRESRKRLEDARSVVAELTDPVLNEAQRRGEAYVLEAYYFGVLNRWPFLTLAEAVGEAQGDCSPERITGPGGPYTPYGDPEPAAHRTQEGRDLYRS